MAAWKPLPLVEGYRDRRGVAEWWSTGVRDRLPQKVRDPALVTRPAAVHIHAMLVPDIQPASRPSARASPDQLSGTVERITFHNPDNGYCVLRAKVRGQRDLVTIIGHSPAIGAGEHVEVAGIWVNDRNHGLQFKADTIRTTVPTTLEGLEKYLGSGMIKGIGPV